MLGSAKDEIYFAVCEFLDHEKTCIDCGGEAECSVHDRLRYLCPEGQRLLAWFKCEHQADYASIIDDAKAGRPATLRCEACKEVIA